MGLGVCDLRARARTQREKGNGWRVELGVVRLMGTMMHMLDLFIKIIKFEREKKVTEVEG